MTTASIPHTTEIGMDHAVAEKIADALKAAQPNAKRYHKELDRALDYIRRGFSFTLRGDLLECQSRTSEMQYRAELHTCNCPGFTYNAHCFHPALLIIVVMYDTMTQLGTPEPVPQPTLAPAYLDEAGPARTRMSDAERERTQQLVDELF